LQYINIFIPLVFTSSSDIAFSKTYFWSTLAYTLVVFVSGGLSWFAPTIIQHGYKMQNTTGLPDKMDDARLVNFVGFTFGLLAAVGGLLGVLSGTTVSQVFFFNTD
jgi:hypothetical protein